MPVFPPKKTVDCPGVGIDPRTPQNFTRVVWSATGFTLGSTAWAVATSAGGARRRWLLQSLYEFLELDGLGHELRDPPPPPRSCGPQESRAR